MKNYNSESLMKDSVRYLISKGMSAEECAAKISESFLIGYPYACYLAMNAFADKEKKRIGPLRKRNKAI